MALIKCPECRKEISDKAGACPHCGCPVSYANDAPVKTNIDFGGLIEKIKPKKNVCIGVIILCFVVCASIFINLLKPAEKPMSIQENLLGEWSAGNENGEASLVFERNSDEYIGKWTVYDYRIEEWNEIKFVIKNIENHIMTILLDDGKIESIPFAVSKNTLVFDNTEYKNEEKNISIPINEYAYIVDDVIYPVTYGCYMGMTKEEVEEVVAPLKVEHTNTHSYCMLPEDRYGKIKLSFHFHEDYGLQQIVYHLDDNYYDENYKMVDYLSDIYGKYKKENNDDSCYYSWYSGNLVIRLYDFYEMGSISIYYNLDSDWEVEYRINNSQ